MLAFARDGLWRPRSAFFQSVVDATGVSRERVLITTHRAVLASLGFAKSFPMKCLVCMLQNKFHFHYHLKGTMLPEK